MQYSGRSSAQGMRKVYAYGYQLAGNGGEPIVTFNQFMIAYGGKDFITPDGKLHTDDPKVREAAIKALTKPEASFWMNPAYRIPLGRFPLVARFTSQETAANTPITEIVVNSLITNPLEGATVKAGAPVTVGGPSSQPVVLAAPPLRLPPVGAVGGAPPPAASGVSAIVRTSSVRPALSRTILSVTGSAGAVFR